MKLSMQGWWKFTMIYVALSLGIYTALFFGLRWWQGRMFTEVKLNQLIWGRGKWSDITDDPCRFPINGDPFTKNYVKVAFICAKDKRSTVTIDTEAVGDKSYRGMIGEVARILRFDPQMMTAGKWKCFDYDRPIIEMKLIPENKTLIRCFAREELYEKMGN